MLARIRLNTLARGISKTAFMLPMCNLVVKKLSGLGLIHRTPPSALILINIELLNEVSLQIDVRYIGTKTPLSLLTLGKLLTNMAIR